MTTIIRKAEPKDAKFIRNVAVISFHDTYETIIPEEVQDSFLNKFYNEDTLQNRISATPFVVLEREGEILGFANFIELDKGKSELSAFYLLPDEKLKGYGTRILEEGIHLFNLPLPMFVNVEAENESALTFYLRKGFVEFERFDDDFYGYKLPTVRLHLTHNVEEDER
ncbi:GNAT family acetyltransferase [Listeria floridensis FSL S10-1187]|uniref:GNAT family acetyltransferase n=1 Tax=Listeria floridensis FSL S10-1187 TaxID=1265817 RepID=A0ABN0RIC6_9LIST|nr:GNAT family N-acetyltransferase [Listeria floridensis]EUJ33659.1 GNAT family acetyltransferase [Listeria floridensis FSL S10-1187]